MVGDELWGLGSIGEAGGVVVVVPVLLLRRRV